VLDDNAASRVPPLVSGQHRAMVWHLTLMLGEGASVARVVEHEFDTAHTGSTVAGSPLDVALVENPYRVGKPLTSWEGYYSARRSEWRIIYRIDDHRVLVEVITIAHRADSYRPR